MNPFVNPIIRARVTSRLQEKTEGQSLEELAQYLQISEKSVGEVLETLKQEDRATMSGGKWRLTKSARPNAPRLAETLMKEARRSWLSRRAS
jgi:hypothetical protein